MTVPTGEVRIMSDLSQAITKLRALSPQLNAAVIEADRVVCTFPVVPKSLEAF